MTPSPDNKTLADAVTHHQAGRFSDAERLYRKLLATQPRHAEALYLLGALAAQNSHLKEAVELIQQSLAIQPNSADAHGNLAGALHRMGRFEEAVAAHQKSIALNPSDAAAHNNLASTMLELRRYPAAVEACARALMLQPRFAEAYFNLGLALGFLGKFDDAALAYRRTTELKPRDPVAHFKLANTLRVLGRRTEAVKSYEAALRLDPKFFDAFNNLGLVLSHLGQTAAAVACLNRALALRPDNAASHANLGNVHKNMAEIGPALAHYRRAVELEPSRANWHSNLVVALHLNPDSSQGDILTECRAWAERHEQPLVAAQLPHERRKRNGRLRIGYVSPDFRDHVVGRNVLPLLREHDRTQFEVFCYSNAETEDDFTQKVRGVADHWRPIAPLADAAVAEMIRADGIDILVDLALHSGRNRLLVFARKPAPVQVTFAGYPGGTGLRSIDYRLSDPHLDAPGRDRDYVEKTLRLPVSFWCYDPAAMTLDPNEPMTPLPAATDSCFTFGCLNNFCKVNDAVLALWRRVLNAVPQSRLVMLAPPGPPRQRVIDRLGLGADRVWFVARLGRRQYFETYHEIDLALDTFPYNGHTTTLDALWMGVPTVTLLGHTIVGRAGLSQLSNVGLPQFVGNSPDQFVQIATEWAADLPRLAPLRKDLRRRMLDSPLTDAKAFARAVEQRYRDITPA